MKRKYDLQVFYGENKETTCIGPECDRPAKVHRMCNTHYCQVRRGWKFAPIKPSKGAKSSQEQG